MQTLQKIILQVLTPILLYLAFASRAHATIQVLNNELVPAEIFEAKIFAPETGSRITFEASILNYKAADIVTAPSYDEYANQLNSLRTDLSSKTATAENTISAHLNEFNSKSDKIITNLNSARKKFDTFSASIDNSIKANLRAQNCANLNGEELNCIKASLNQWSSNNLSQARGLRYSDLTHLLYRLKELSLNSNLAENDKVEIGNILNRYQFFIKQEGEHAPN